MSSQLDQDTFTLLASQLIGSIGANMKNIEFDINSYKKTDYENVCEFTVQSTGRPIPTTPMKFSKTQLEFLIQNMCSELIELAETITESPLEAKEFVLTCIEKADLHTNVTTFTSDEDIVVSQADAIVDVMYYALNGCAKNGIDVSACFDEVHRSNMNKRDPVTGKFNRREDGKILKPNGWIGPDLKSVLYPSV